MITSGIQRLLLSFASIFRVQQKTRSSLASQIEGYPAPTNDTFTAITELSKVVKNNPDALEIYLALGNLYRAQGEIDRAIQIRNNLIVRPSLQPEYKVKALYELGLDYKRGGFLDRSLRTFEQARELIGNDPAIIQELAVLNAASNDFQQAAHFYGVLKKPIPQAHYLVQLSKTLLQQEEYNKSEHWLNKALHIYPASIEAWLEYIIRAYEENLWNQLEQAFSKALRKIEPHLRFVLLEGLIQYLFKKKENKEIFTPTLSTEAGHIFIHVLKNAPENLLLYYYGAWLYLQIGDKEQAKQWLEKCLTFEGNFWPARMELLFLTLNGISLDPNIKGQLEFFLNQIRQIKKFICTRCGLKREHIFFVCPRCQTWHSIAFIKTLEN
jgi:lipopolysaccharide biosynthesis regulator YciM